MLESFIKYIDECNVEELFKIWLDFNKDKEFPGKYISLPTRTIKFINYTSRLFE